MWGDNLKKLKKTKHKNKKTVLVGIIMFTPVWRWKRNSANEFVTVSVITESYQKQELSGFN